ncbi:RNA recognition motif [Mactra antiquata]
MPRKRPTESSWDSDEELLGDVPSVSAFSSKKGVDEDIDEDALLSFGDEGNQDGRDYSFATSEIDIGLDSSDIGLDVTADSQELDYEDIPEDTVEEFILEENIEDPLMVDEQPNDTVCTVRNTQEEVNDDDSDDDNDKRDRSDRFQTERKQISTTKTSTIPDNLEITEEMQAEIDTFEKQKGKGKKRRGGKLQQQQQQQRFQHQNNRGRGQMRGPNIGQRMVGPGGRVMGPRGVGPARMRGPQGFQRPMGAGPMNQNSTRMPRGQMFNNRPQRPNQNMAGGHIPRYPHEMGRGSMQGPRHGSLPRQPIPQQYVSSPGTQIQHSQQSQYAQPVHSHNASPIQQPIHAHTSSQQPVHAHTPTHQQVHAHTPTHQPAHPHTPTHQPVHSHPSSMQQPVQSLQPQSLFSQPQMIHHQQQPTGSNIHVNPKFQGNITPSSVHASQQQQQQQQILHQPQPLLQQQRQQQPAHNYGDSNQGWGGHGIHNTPGTGGYPPPQQSTQMLSPQPLIAEHRPQGTPHHHQHQHQSPAMIQQPGNQMQPRPLLSPQQPFPNHQQPNNQHMRPTRPGQPGLRTPGNMMRPQRPQSGQRPNIRDPRPGVTPLGNPRQMRPNNPGFKPRNQQFMPRQQVPTAVVEPENQGWNPSPVTLSTAVVKPENDPEREKKLKEMEEKKRLRAERFKSNTPVQVDASNPGNKKIITTKRPSCDDPSFDIVSPSKTMKIETLANMKTDSTAVTSDEALKKALDEQKKRRELIMKIKEAKRQALAEQKRKALVTQEGNQPDTGIQPMETQQVQIQKQQGQLQQSQGQVFNTQNRGRGRGQNINRGRGQGHNNNRAGQGQSQGQPISVLGQKSNLVQIPVDNSQGRGQGFNRGRGQTRGQIQNRGQGRGGQNAPNVVHLQQVEFQDSVQYDISAKTPVHEPNKNRTVLTSAAGMNPRGAASQGHVGRVAPQGNVSRAAPQSSVGRGRTVIDKSEDSTAPRRIVLNSLDSPQSSTVLIKDVPANVDIGKINKKCSQHGNIKSFNYRGDERKIIVQYTSPSEAAAFLKKNPKFMIDMGYLTAMSIPDSSI